HDQFDSVDEFTTALDEYIHWYNTERVSTKLKGLRLLLGQSNKRGPVQPRHPPPSPCPLAWSRSTAPRVLPDGDARHTLVRPIRLGVGRLRMIRRRRASVWNRNPNASAGSACSGCRTACIHSFLRDGRARSGARERAPASAGALLQCEV
ncbi:IS3 family transposase, partial [Agromyces sp. Soil535]|uniref:IS3 family transposase n=1 Tax=Agromyces sp. Soil535 TaxID=1736390 RepID=UPI0012E3EF7B